VWVEARVGVDSSMTSVRNMLPDLYLRPKRSSIPAGPPFFTSTRRGTLDNTLRSREELAVSMSSNVPRTPNLL